MSIDGAPAAPREGAIDDVAYLVRSEHRVPALAAMAARPRTRGELRELTGASPSTIRRTLRAFEDCSWVRRDGHRYGATALGTAVANGVETLLDLVQTERTLRDVWTELPDAILEVALEQPGRTTVTVAEHDAPYGPVNRFRSLLRETDRFRFVGFDVGLYDPCTDEFGRRVLEGMDAELIDSPDVAAYMLSTYPERCDRLLESGNLTALVHDELPSYGISRLDDRVAVSGYDPDSGGVTVLVDTDAPEACEWADAVYATYRNEARPLETERVEDVEIEA
ncbi:MarR family transcriptional regulator [Natronococcus sp. A-GB7]|uniref:helix-turn-helix transcriptional regulator n=1 Tax=Natronococcus sp. A-GB7 TaxID=3037649 RepID=UPI00241C191F|nr:MarR family transcriptional regulator [Natronococcus sp. A-GB7]MDG5819270.1 MarR family transcriptional regulator [Natronococcus sp. A-GB7]